MTLRVARARLLSDRFYDILWNHHNDIREEKLGGVIPFIPEYQYWYQFDIGASLVPSTAALDCMGSMNIRVTVSSC